jgi:hypothetical protein
MITRRLLGTLAFLLFLAVTFCAAQSTNFPLGNFSTINATGQIVSTLATGTAPFSIASTTPVTNLNVANAARMQFCGTTVACAATALTSSQVVFGSAPLSSGTPSTAVITGISPAFTSSTSYKCLASDVTTITNQVVAVTYSSGSSFTINGPATVTDTVEYICAGN